MLCIGVVANISMSSAQVHVGVETHATDVESKVISSRLCRWEM